MATPYHLPKKRGALKGTKISFFERRVSHRRQRQNKQTKIKVSGQQLTNARIGLHTHNQACMCRQDYVYTSPCPENLTTQKHGRTLK